MHTVHTERYSATETDCFDQGGQTPACKQCVKDAGCADTFTSCSGFTAPSGFALVDASKCTGAADPKADVCYEGSAKELEHLGLWRLQNFTMLVNRHE